MVTFGGKVQECGGKKLEIEGRARNINVAGCGDCFTAVGTFRFGQLVQILEERR